MNRILLCRFADGGTDLTVSGVALLVGVSTEELRDRWNPEMGVDALPDDLKRRGAKRGYHARRATGTNATTVNAAYLAARDWGARIDFDEQAGEMWAVTDAVG